MKLMYDFTFVLRHCVALYDTDVSLFKQ